MRLLVTGGLGFIGSNFIRHILKTYDYSVVNLDKVTYAGNFDNAKEFENNDRYSFVKGDICDRSVIQQISDVDVIVNFAAETHVDKSIIQADAFVKTDVLGVFNLLEVARQRGIRLVHVSTDEVYGSIDSGSFTEESCLRPNSPYAASKAGGDLLAQSYFKTHGSDVVITRSSNNFGPYQYPEKFIPLFITNLLDSQKIPLYGDGKNVRDWLYVVDNCEAIDAVMRKGKAGEVYNIASGEEKMNVEVAELLLKELGSSDEMIERVRDRKAHDFRYSMVFDKVQQLGWKPRFRFGSALSDTVRWYKENQWWWKKLKSGEFLEYYRKYYATLGMKA